MEINYKIPLRKQLPRLQVKEVLGSCIKFTKELKRAVLRGAPASALQKDKEGFVVLWDRITVEFHSESTQVSFHYKDMKVAFVQIAAPATEGSILEFADLEGKLSVNLE